MRGWLVAAAALLLLLALAVVAEAPATLVDRQLDASTHGRLRIAEAAGTVWNGSGALVVLPYGSHIPVSWHIDALPLLRSRLKGTLGENWAPPATTQRPAFDLGSDDFSVRGMAFALPAEALLRATDAPAVISGAGGTIDLRADAFAMSRGAFDGGFVAALAGTRACRVRGRTRASRSVTYASKGPEAGNRPGRRGQQRRRRCRHRRNLERFCQRRDQRRDAIEAARGP